MRFPGSHGICALGSSPKPAITSRPRQSCFANSIAFGSFAQSPPLNLSTAKRNRSIARLSTLHRNGKLLPHSSSRSFRTAPPETANRSADLSRELAAVTPYPIMARSYTGACRATYKVRCGVAHRGELNADRFVPDSAGHVGAGVFRIPRSWRAYPSAAIVRADLAGDASVHLANRLAGAVNHAQYAAHILLVGEVLHGFVGELHQRAEMRRQIAKQQDPRARIVTVAQTDGADG